MAQSGFTAIQLYSSPTPGASPAASNLASGEVAINAADGKLFYKDTANNTQVIANSAWSSFSSGVAIQGSGTSVVPAGTVQFANSNGVTFGLNGSTMTASISPQSVASYNIVSAGGNTAGVLATFSSGTVVLAGGNNITLSQNSNTISVNAAGANITMSAGTTSTVTNSFVLSASNNVVFGLNGNTITASQFNKSTVPINQWAGYFADASPAQFNGRSGTDTKIVASNLLYPLQLGNALSVQNLAMQINFDQPNGGSLSFPASALPAASDFAYTNKLVFYHAIYSENGGTLSNVTTFEYPVEFTNSFATATAAVASAGSYSFTQSATIQFPIGTSSNGPIYNTLSATRAFSTNANTTLAAVNLGVNMANQLSLSNIAGVRNATACLTSPLTLAPNAYWVVANVSATATVGTKITLDSAYALPFDLQTNNKVGIRVLQVATTERLSDATAVFMSTQTQPYSNYNIIFASTNGTSIVATGYTAYTTTVDGISQSLLLSNLTFSVPNTQGWIPRAPIVTYF